MTEDRDEHSTQKFHIDEILPKSSRQDETEEDEESRSRDEQEEGEEEAEAGG